MKTTNASEQNCASCNASPGAVHLPTCSGGDHRLPDTRKAKILSLLRAFTAQRPGLNPHNYNDCRSLRAESRSITKDLHTFRILCRDVELIEAITADDLIQGFRAFSGRLSLKTTDNGEFSLHYVTGQYFPTEYRRAACAVLASVLWNYKRNHCIPDNCHNPGDFLRKSFRADYGRSIAKNYFD